VSSRARIIVLILTAQTVANVGPLGIPAVASLIRADLGLTLAQAGSFLSAYYIGPSLVSLPAGTLADRWGVKRLLVLGQLVIALGLVAASAATSYAALVLLLVAAGFGYGILNPTSTKAVMAWAPPAHRATLVGFKQVGLPLGGMLGAALLPGLAVGIGWRPALIVSAVLVAAGAAASVVVYRDPLIRGGRQQCRATAAPWPRSSAAATSGCCRSPAGCSPPCRPCGCPSSCSIFRVPSV
jgi:MFS family permease